MDSVKKKALLRRMLAKVAIDPKTECWNWQGCRKETGHGKIKVDGKAAAVHRVSYELHVGPIEDGLVIRHKCDNASCINPLHLEPGTQLENVRDTVARGRLNPISFLNLTQHKKAA